jgi:ABC-type transporter Mla MlaB component
MTATQSPSSGFELFTRAWPALARTHLTVRGPLSLATCAELVDAINAALEPGHQITLDLSEVTAIDAGGVQAVRDCEALAERGRAEVIVQDPSPTARRALGAPAA